MKGLRLASLNRFREKWKERCFDKKIRYTVRKRLPRGCNGTKGNLPHQSPLQKTRVRKKRRRLHSSQDQGEVYVFDAVAPEKAVAMADVINEVQFGNLGLVHSFYKLYRAEDVGCILSILSKLVTFHLQASSFCMFVTHVFLYISVSLAMNLQMYGFTCGMDDHSLFSNAECKHDTILQDSNNQFHARFVGYDIESSSISLNYAVHLVPYQGLFSIFRIKCFIRIRMDESCIYGRLLLAVA